MQHKPISKIHLLASQARQRTACGKYTSRDVATSLSTPPVDCLACQRTLRYKRRAQYEAIRGDIVTASLPRGETQFVDGVWYGV